MLFKKTMTCFLLIVLLILGLSIISYAKEDLVELNYWTISDEKYLDEFKVVFNEFHEKYPNITVKLETFPYGDYSQKIITSSMVGEGPDLLKFSRDLTKTYVRAGIFTDLTNYVQDYNVDLEDFMPAFLKSCYIDNKLYALPWESDIRVLFYNKDILDELGYSNPPETWDEFLEIANKAYSDTNGDGKIDRYGFAFPGQGRLGLQYLFPFLVTNDGHLLNDAGDKANFTDSNIKEWIEFTKEIVKISPPEVFSYSFAEPKRMFAEGNVAFYVSGYWEIGGPIDTSGVNYGLAKVPANKNDGSAAVGGWVMGIPSFSKHKEEAWLLMNYLMSPEVCVRVNNMLPARYSVINYERYDNSAVKVFMEVAKTTETPITYTSHHSEVINILTDEVLKYYFNKQTLDQALTKANEKVQEVLDN